MLKIMVSQWDRNKDDLHTILSRRTDLYEIEYKDLVKLTFEIIYNNGLHEHKDDILDLERIHEIDDGDYQGTLLYLIPFDSYQPSEHEYLMTYVGYGSCSGCDALLSIQARYDGAPCKQMVDDLMALCKDIITNTIKPYNGGWRQTEAFEQIEEEK